MQPPNPNPSIHNHSDAATNHQINTAQYTLYYPNHPQLQNSNPNPNPNHGGGYEVQPSDGLAYAQYQTAPPYYVDPNTGATMYNWAVAVTGGTLPSGGTEQFVPAIPISGTWANATVLPQRISKKGPKTTKVVQSQWCEVCKICCNTKDVLDQHKLGKKHKKNLEKLQKASMPPPAPAPAPAPAPVASAGSNNPVIGPPVNPSKGKNSKKKAPNSAEGLETKRRKIVESGAAAADVRTCVICNVVCNSDTVFKAHIAGQKHVAMVKKCASGSISFTTAI